MYVLRIKDSTEDEGEGEDIEEDIEENKHLRHQSFNRIDTFMNKFFDLPIFRSNEEDPLEELTVISEKYKEYLEKIKIKMSENSEFKSSIEKNLVCINNIISTKYAKYDKIKLKVNNLNYKINQKFYEIRYSHFVPEKLNHSVWKKPIRELKNITFEKSPHKKMESLVKCLTAVSRAYLLLSDQSDEVTADDILQFSSFIFIKSEINDLAGYLEYIKAFHYTPQVDMQGIEQY